MNPLRQLAVAVVDLAAFLIGWHQEARARRWAETTHTPLDEGDR